MTTQGTAETENVETKSHVTHCQAVNALARLSSQPSQPSNCVAAAWLSSAPSLLAEVRLKDYGAECLEVTDNGSGIEPECFESLGGCALTFNAYT